MAGILKKLGQALGNVITGGAGKLKDELAEELPAPKPETPPIIPATGQPVPPPMTGVEMDDSIQALGSQGEMGPIEAGDLHGRAPTRRNINLDFFADDSTKATIEYFNYRAGGFEEVPGRQVKPHAETIDLSITGAKDPAELRERMNKIVGGSIDDKWETQDLVGIYSLMQKQGEELTAYAKELKAMKLSGAVPSTEDLAHYQLLATRFTALQEISSVRAAEAGRMLNSLQAVSKAGGTQYYRDLDNIVRGAGGESSIWANIDGVAAAGDDLAKQAAAARGGIWAKVYQTALQVRYNMMLSSVRTHAANILGSVATGIWESVVVNPTKIGINNVEFAGRAMVHSVFGKGGMRAQDRIALSELISVPVTTVRSMRAAFANAKDVFNGEAMGHGKVYNELGISTSGGGEGAIPRALQIPTRLLEAEDAFFRSTYFNSKLSQLAKREALLKAEVDDDVSRLYQQYMDSPPPAMMDEALEYAGKLTFTNDPSAYGSFLGTFAKTMSTIQDHPVGRLVLPFVRTPVNLFGYALEQGGVGKLIAPKKLFAELQNPETRADAEARIAIAAGLYYYLKDYWDEGKITGASPDNYGVLRARQTAGWRENAIRLGDEYYQLNRLDPLGLILAGYATTYSATEHTTVEDTPTAIVAAIAEVASMLSDRSVLSGLGDLERVFQASEGSVGKQFGKQIARMATSFIIPALARDFREGKDAYRRSLEVPDKFGPAVWASINKTVRNAWPGASEGLPPQVDAFGDDMLNIGGWAWRGLVPIKRAEIKQDPVAVALIATATPMNKPAYLIGLPNGPKIDLLAIDGGEGWVYRAYQQDIGRARYQAIQKLVKTAGWQNEVDKDAISPDSVAGDMVRKVVRDARRIASLAFIKKMSGKTSFTPTVAGEQVAGTIQLAYPVSLDQYKVITNQLRREGPTDANLEAVRDLGMKYKHKPTQKGLPPEMRF